MVRDGRNPTPLVDACSGLLRCEVSLLVYFRKRDELLTSATHSGVGFGSGVVDRGGLGE